MSEIEEGRQRTAAATAARKRKGEQRKAAELSARGWVCVPPERVGGIPASILAELSTGTRNAR